MINDVLPTIVIYLNRKFEIDLDKAIAAVKKSQVLKECSGLLEINEKIYDYIVNLQLTVEEVIDNKKTPITVKFIDFDNIDNNDFLVVNQFKVHGDHENIIPDIVLFINGMPISVIECKSPFKGANSDENVGKTDGYRQLRRYMNLRDEIYT